MLNCQRNLEKKTIKLELSWSLNSDNNTNLQQSKQHDADTTTDTQINGTEESQETNSGTCGQLMHRRGMKIHYGEETAASTTAAFKT